MVDIPCANADAVVVAALSKLGAGYDYVDLLGVVLHANWLQVRRYFCSEFVAWGFSQGGTPLLSAELARVTPQHLWMLPAPAQTAGKPEALLNLA